MASGNLSPELSEAFKLLGFHEFTEYPKLGEVRKAFFKSARFNHPDKNSNVDQNTKEEREDVLKKVLNAYNLICEAVIECPTVEDDEDDFEDVEDDEDDAKMRTRNYASQKKSFER